MGATDQGKHDPAYFSKSAADECASTRTLASEVIVLERSWNEAGISEENIGTTNNPIDPPCISSRHRAR
jgi:hypothetical protein